MTKTLVSSTRLLVQAARIDRKKFEREGNNCEGVTGSSGEFDDKICFNGPQLLLGQKKTQWQVARTYKNKASEGEVLVSSVLRKRRHTTSGNAAITPIRNSVLRVRSRISSTHRRAALLDYEIMSYSKDPAW